MMGDETDEIIEKFFESLLQSYQKDLKESTRRSELNFDSVDSLYYHHQKNKSEERWIIYRFS